MMNNISHIVVAANPFGFGPTGNAIPILDELNARFFNQSNIRIYFVGSSKCQSIVPDIPNIRRVFLDERDEVVLGNFLKSLRGRIFVLGIQNRFIITAGKSLGCKTAFFDVLAWMWTEISETHFAADEIFWMRFPGIIERRQHYSYYGKNIHIIEGVYKKTPQRKKASARDNKKVLFCLGGGFNPLRDGVQENYLLLLASVLRASHFSKMDIEIVTGENTANFLRSIKGAPSIEWKISTLDHSEILDRISSAKFFLSVGGQSSTMEAIFSGALVYFFVPSNLSQILLQMNIASGINRDDILWWKNEFLELMESSKYLSEKDCIELIEVIAGNIVNDPKKLGVLTSRFNSIFDSLSVDESYSSKLESFGKRIGSNGSVQIVTHIEGFIRNGSSIIP